MEALRVSRRTGGVFTVVACLSLAGCASTYYGALEKIGIEKRDILVDRVEDARDAQGEAKEQFSSALDQYRQVIAVDGGELEKVYDRLKSEFERSEKRADEVRERIDAVESVAEDLFEEWEDELDAYSDPKLKRQSQSLLNATRADYRDLLSAMQRAERSMDPVLSMFNDQVLFLRHNLNARALGSLESELSSIEQATATVVADMQRAIDEAGQFIESMR